MDSTITVPVATIEEGSRIPLEVLEYVPKSSATYYQFVPLRVSDGVLEVGMMDSNNLEARDAIQFIASKIGLPFKIFSIGKDDFERALKGYEGLTSQVTKALGDLDSEIKNEEKKQKTESGSDKKEVKIVEDAPVTKIVAVILQHASSGNASDIHIEPTPENVRVRFRVDGSLHSSLFLPSSVLDAVVARIKILTNMRLDERRKPQDGRFSARVEGRKIDFRVSTMPTYYGEKVVIRILDSERQLLTFSQLGLTPINLNTFERALKRPYGMILVTGPTGSGKTSTLYSMLQVIDRESNNVVSLEDPIEYSVPDVSQSQVRPEINYTFANGLRSILRQDPDIIMVGEIRDSETAKLAIQAALTGHLVLSTLHTNNAAGVIPRLVDMGIDPYLIAATLILAVAQRLVPTLCAESKQEVPLDGGLRAVVDKYLEEVPEEVKKTIEIPKSIFRPQPSPTCSAGVRGRMAVFEVLEMDHEFEQLMLSTPTEEAISSLARKKGFLTMREDALLKAFKGLISFEEVSKL
ncbi:type II/IV secretion system protein [Candidatus Nomurabacteria bacterium]|nr:type II/IV secretion system protein [Candidatus Nomurabacteria bacterium]